MNCVLDVKFNMFSLKYCKDWESDTIYELAVRPSVHIVYLLEPQASDNRHHIVIQQPAHPATHPPLPRPNCNNRNWRPGDVLF